MLKHFPRRPLVIARLIASALLAIAPGALIPGCGGLNYQTGPWPTRNPAPLPGPSGRDEPTFPNHPAPPHYPDRADDELIFWTWQPPMGRAAMLPNVTEFVRVLVRDPEWSADAVCRQILRRNLRHEQIAIILQNFGAGHSGPEARVPALCLHEDDGLSRDIDNWQMTVWYRHGIIECTTWMNRFIARYQHNQRLNPNIPNPFRFHFDNEAMVNPHRRKTGYVEVVDAMMKDRRWNSEPITGFGGKTLATLYREAGSPRYTLGVHRDQNAAFVSWYAGIAWTSADAAMNEAAYEPIRRAWPGCKSSNYWTSAAFDGRGDPPRLRARSGSVQFPTRPYGDLQAPVLYTIDAEDYAGDTSLEATVNRARDIVRINSLSYGGPNENITPWIMMIGQNETSPELFESMIHMLREYRVREFLIWSRDITQKVEYWNALAEIVGRAE